MSETSDAIVGINWGSSNFRAHLIAPDGLVLDSLEAPAGVASLQRDGMVGMADRVRARWPHATRVYAAGMIGSNVGWTDAGYADCPAGIERLCERLVPTRIGELALHIVPGLACVRERDGAPDVMRGEETELLGLHASGRLGDAPLVALPGTHTKWVAIADGRVVEFMTAMSGEVYDRLTAAGLLASIVEGAGRDGHAFRDGVRTSASRTLGLGALLFGARARVIRGMLPKADASAYLRGLLIGSEIADALALFPRRDDVAIPLVGSPAVCALYAAALEELGLTSRTVASADAIARGFVEIDARVRAR
ncbi:2-dehydro-3-deoxygalactonokinase [Lysobacter changpingensis]|uniref:2-dehydro-3-deoxygalactonokinase n=1 Tax=Lysobacter changpingensis TaxID=2792784 RepID=UPI001A8E3648|nr:2-dehydro-3-deoxygalactonokinase [Lysobacter changpingensis]